MKCEYGCNQKANYQLKNGKWCCKNTTRKCIAIIKKSSKTRTGVKRTKEQIRNISQGHIGQKSKKKGLTYQEIYGKRSIEIKKKMRNKKLLTKNLNKIKIKFPFLIIIEKFKVIDKDVHVKCKNNNCNKWFIPTYTQIYERNRALISPSGFEENNFYCSEDCKISCILYGLNAEPLEKLYTQEEYQIFREEVLKRANFKCEYCDEKATDVHHSRPQKLEPGFVLDPDFGIACCEKHHYKYGHKKGTECSTGNLAKQIC